MYGDRSTVSWCMDSFYRFCGLDDFAGFVLLNKNLGSRISKVGSHKPKDQIRCKDHHREKLTLNASYDTPGYVHRLAKVSRADFLNVSMRYMMNRRPVFAFLLFPLRLITIKFVSFSLHMVTSYAHM